MAEKKKRKRGYLKRLPKAPPARREEAVRLLRTLAEHETDPGAQGYSEGMADRIEAGDCAVTEYYVEGLRRAVAERTTGTSDSAAPKGAGNGR